jgi:uncharacterized membrane protein
MTTETVLLSIALLVSACGILALSDKLKTRKQSNSYKDESSVSRQHPLFLVIIGLAAR